MSWLTTKSAERIRPVDTEVWREATAGEFPQAEQDGLLRHELYDRIDEQRVEGVFLTRRSIYARSFSPISEKYYGPLTHVPLDRILWAGPIGAADSARWGLVVAEPDADVERGEQPLTAYAYECGSTRAARARSQDFVAALRDVIPTDLFRILDSPQAADSARKYEAGLLLSATVDAPDLRRDLERSWEVLDARSRGLPVPTRQAQTS
ncbi:hypothetical protein GCM10009798_01380 [Nocardioides panacihumi]|uniref:Uncharacterized protein n=1 Tax=Nocardioides panacihumi TaxID=400774 RepID=A0ABN2Q755_9ACTN